MPRPRSVEDSELLPRAMLLFWRNGYARTGIRELEQTLGMKAPSIYNRFGSKEALFHASIAHYLERVVRYRIERYLRGPDALAGLREFFDTTYDYVTRGRAPLSCLLVNTALELQPDEPELARLLDQGGLLIRGAFREVLQRAQAQGQLRADADVSSLAECLYLGLQGLLVCSKVERNPRVLRKRTDALFQLLPLTAAATQR